MEFFKFVLGAGALFLAWQGFVIICNHAQVECNEYLELLTFDEWKCGEELRLEMQRIKERRIPRNHFYASMRTLVDEGCIERQDSTRPQKKWPDFRRRKGRRPVRLLPKPPGSGDHPLHAKASTS